MWWAFEILSCLKFLFVTGSENIFRSKRVYEFLIPLILTVAVSIIYFQWPEVFLSTALANLSKNIFQFMVFVVPFHLAALGAFATFNAKGLDEKLAGVNAQLKVWSNRDNGYFYKDLTLRQYVSLLFGYLCSIGLMYIFVFVIFSNVNLKSALGEFYIYVNRVGFIAGVLFVSHYSVLTLYAITFLFDKVNKIRSE